jgi:hypothetical protein
MIEVEVIPVSRRGELHAAFSKILTNRSEKRGGAVMGIILPGEVKNLLGTGGRVAGGSMDLNLRAEITSG